MSLPDAASCQPQCCFEFAPFYLLDGLLHANLTRCKGLYRLAPIQGPRPECSVVLCTLPFLAHVCAGSVALVSCVCCWQWPLGNPTIEWFSWQAHFASPTRVGLSIHIFWLSFLRSSSDIFLRVCRYFFVCFALLRLMISLSSLSNVSAYGLG